MTRRRATLGAALVAVVLVAGALAALLAKGHDDPAVPAVDPAALTYARGWQATCTALRADAGRTTALLRGRVGGRPPGPAARRRLARTVVSPYLGRTQRRLRRQASATPPPAWRAYHRVAARELLRVAERTGAVRSRVRDGDLAGLGDLAPAAVGAAPPAPADLRERTPACTT